jgi:plasmid stability protein
MDPNIKNIQLTGPLAGGSDGKSRKKSVKGPRKTFKIDHEGGGGTSPGTLTQMEASRLPGVPPPGTPEAVGVDSPLTGTGAPLTVSPAATTQSAGKKDVPMKIVLAAAKKKKGGVVLAAAKTKVGDSKTKKISKTKKVRVTISNLGKKIHKAKEIRKAATDTSIEDVKKELQKAALIKPESKAPDAMLRQLYADFMMLKGRAL